MEKDNFISKKEFIDTLLGMNFEYVSDYNITIIKNFKAENGIDVVPNGYNIAYVGNFGKNRYRS